MPWLTAVSTPPPAPPQSWVVPSTLSNTWKSQLSTYTGCPASVQTSSHLDSSACVTRCPGHHGHPKTCQDTYQDIPGVRNRPGHSGCPELSTKSWLLWSSYVLCCCTNHYTVQRITLAFEHCRFSRKLCSANGQSARIAFRLLRIPGCVISVKLHPQAVLGVKACWKHYHGHGIHNVWTKCNLL